MKKADRKIPLFRVFALLALAFLIGTALASFICIDFLRSENILLYSCVLLFFCALLNSILKNWPLVLAAYFFMFVLFGTVHYSFFDYRLKPALSYDEEISIEGKIVGKPSIDYKKQQVFIIISAIRNQNESLSFNKGSKILVELPHYPAVHSGDKLKFEGKVQKPGVINGFDWGKYLKKDQVFGVVLSPKELIASSDNLTAKDKIYRYLYYVSDRMEESLNQILPEPHASLSAGLILGIKRNIPDDLQNELNTDGLTHIIALSGYNITIIVAVLSALLSQYLNRKQILLSGTVLVAGFIILTGASSSVVRAAIFSLLILLGKNLGREGDQTNLMLLAAVVMLLLNPYLLANDVGFQLSFLAFCGLIYLSPIVAKIFERSKLQNLPDWFKLPLIETLAAQIAVFPLILVVFGRVSIIGPIANVLVLWIIPLSMALVFMAGLLGIAFYPLGKLAAMVAWPALQYIIKMVELLSKVPGASVSFGARNWLIAACLYLVLIISAILLARRYKLKLI